MSKDDTITGFNTFAGADDQEKNIDAIYKPVPAGLEFDEDRYRQALGECDLDNAQAVELLRIVFDMMRSFVEMGFSAELCGQFLPELFGHSAGNGADGTIGHSTKQELPSAPDGKEAP